MTTDFETEIANCSLTDNIETNFANTLSYLGIEAIVNAFFKIKYNVEDNPTIADVVYFLNLVEPNRLAAALMCMEATHRTGYSNAIIRPMVLSCFVNDKADTQHMRAANATLKERQQLSENQLRYIEQSIAVSAARNKEFDFSFILDIRHMSIVYFNDKQWKDYIYKEYNAFVDKMGHSPMNFTNKFMSSLLCHKYKTSYSTIKRFNVNHQAIINAKKSFVLDYVRELAHLMINPAKA